MKKLVYTGNKTREISFPLGGIGTGCIGLAGNGRLIDWEIFNKPNKGSVNGFSHFAVKAETEGTVVDARVLNGDYPFPYTGMYGDKKFGGYGFGPDRTTLAGVPHFRDVEFQGEFPLARLSFNDEKFPGQVSMTAFNPFIPLNDIDSSIPGAFFEFEIHNSDARTLDYTISFSMSNPHAAGTAVNKYIMKDDMHMIRLTSCRYGKSDVEYGDLTIAADSEEISYQEYWYRGRWFDNLGVYWRDFTSPGKLRNREYDDPAEAASADVCTLAAHCKLLPGEKKHIRFIVTWNFPNCHNSWNPEKCECGSGCCETGKNGTWKNYYATIYNSSRDSALYSLKNWDRLYGDTMKFHDALFSSSLPREVLDAVAGNIAILKTPTCLRLEDGSFYGFEGCHCQEGCCEGSCTHVWNYAYALPFLFPKLERSMRDLDYKYNQREDGSMCFRLQLPLGRERWKFRACADGQFGGVIKTYRDWKISGDTEWLKSNWEAVKKSIEFAWSPTNEDKWDEDKDGVLEGRQHHTLDMELFGPNSWLTGFYLAALKSGAEMAECLGETEKAKEYMELFHKGKLWVADNLFNGEYFYQLVNLKDKSLLEKYNTGNSMFGDTTLTAYWNEEAGEIKYQIGEGCGVDQIVAQWHSDICGLGDIFDNDQADKALHSIYKYNYKKNMRDYFNPCRLYCLNDEGGVVICDWPEGKYKPVVPAPYSEETMNGFEYQAACHMIRRGMINEGLEIVRAIRDRYDGEKRNPWNEFECGSNYARSMASYDLLLALSGFEFDQVSEIIGFNPLELKGDYSCFWSLNTGWGKIDITSSRISIQVLYGSLKIKKVKLPFISGKDIGAVSIGGTNLQYSMKGNFIDFAESSTIDEKNPLTIDIL